MKINSMWDCPYLDSDVIFPDNPEDDDIEINMCQHPLVDRLDDSCRYCNMEIDHCWFGLDE